MLVYFLGDSLAAQNIGGFKKGVGLTKRPCKMCDVYNTEMSTGHYENNFTLRNEETHKDRCDLLDTLNKEEKLYWSAEYGINERSVLAEIPEFQVTKCILQDPMHLLLEGVDRLVIKLILHTVVVHEKYFKLEDLNVAISNFAYSSSQMLDKPQEIINDELQPSSSMRQSAASMLTLMQCLPFMIGHYIPDNNLPWLNFIRLLQINLLSFSPVVSYKTASTLADLIALHNKTFVELYPEPSFIPKLYYLIHLPGSC